MGVTYVKFIKLNILNTCSSLYINYTSKQLCPNLTLLVGSVTLSRMADNETNFNVTISKVLTASNQYYNKMILTKMMFFKDMLYSCKKKSKLNYIAYIAVCIDNKTMNILHI